MTGTKKDKDQEKGDEVLRRMLKTPPKPKGLDASEEKSQKSGKLVKTRPDAFGVSTKEN
ncbi:hypothetical protein AAFN47_01960 [Hoeflea sp. CAU 1731]